MRARHGMTLVELLVVIAIIGMLVGILLPAVNAARESSRLVTCKNHLRQQAIALRSYAQQYSEALPALWRTQNSQPWENFSWRVELLPFLEEDNRYEQLQKELRPLHEANVPLIGPIEIFNCPSSPSYPREIRHLGYTPEIEEGDLGIGATDYVAIFDVRSAFESIAQSGTWYGGAAPDTIGGGDRLDGTGMPSFQEDVFNSRIRTVPSTLRRVRDGLSNTVLLVEQAGKPARYQRIEAPQAPTNPDTTPSPEGVTA